MSLYTMSPVLQRDYQPPRKQKGEQLDLKIIHFNVKGQIGYPLKDALNQNYNGLDGRDDPFITTGTSVSARLEVSLSLSNRSTL